MKRLGKLFTLMTIGLLPTTTLILSSCSTTENSKYGFDQEDDGQLVLAMGFLKNDWQGLAIQGIVDTYNKWIKDNNKQSEGYLPLKISWLASGYNTSSIALDLKVKNRKDFHNILLNYASAAALYANHKMNLAVDDKDFKKYNIEPVFNVANSLIANNKDNKKWAIPLSRSGEMTAVAKALVGKFVKELMALGVELDSKNSGKLQSYLDYYNNNKQEAEGVDSIWAYSKTTPEDLKKLTPKILHDLPIMSDKLFDNYSDLINFAIQAKRLYNVDPTLNVLGIDEIPSAINVMATSIIGSDINKNYINPDDNCPTTGGYNYDNFIEKPDSPQAKLFKEVSSIILKGIQEGAVWVAKQGVWGTGIFTTYKLAMVITSTAAYHYTFVSENGKNNNYTIKQANRVLNPNTTIEILNDTPKNNEKWLLKFKQLNDKYSNTIWTVDASEKDIKDAGQNPRYIKKISSSSTKEVKKLQGKAGFIVSGPEYSYNKAEDKIELKIGNKITKFQGIYLGKFFNNDNNEYFFIDKKDVEVNVLNANNFINQEDVDIISPPYSYSENEKYRGIILQGPSVIPVHANKREDKATKLFINWMYTQPLNNLELYKVDSKGKKINVQRFPDGTKAIDAFNIFSGYISPTTKFLSQDAKNVTKNIAEEIAFTNFKHLIKEGSIYKPADDVATRRSGQLRDAIKQAARSILSDANVLKIFDYNEFINKIKLLFQE
ncbi:P68 family surface lipoprotein [Metamycoplasma hominis]|uniref:P68 family surface lipoprotein n=1 Tax=Metamycoplasma hominis TaxID=2098 RepID=UPI0034A3B68B